ncbi:MFP1 attachment factor 1-like, partial [Hordeum vulgare subsp. vulgare]|uniref:MFP1 attachment factor 1-like n=1 Tax=Hordeum vulgare subsp. vulgare TaxID=112509 RepID=UPI001D1A46BA
HASFSIWPLTQRTREAERLGAALVDTLAGNTLLCKRYDVVLAVDAEPAARAIEAEAFDAVVVAGGATASVEEGIEALQLYSKEVSRHLLDFVKSRCTAAKDEPPSEVSPAVKKETSEA